MKKNEVIFITHVSYVKDYLLEISFNDGHISVVDFEQFICSSSNPDIIKYKEKKRFRHFKLDNGDLMWGDFEMIFPVIDLYKGIVLKRDKKAC